MLHIDYKTSQMDYQQLQLQIKQTYDSIKLETINKHNEMSKRRQ